MMYNQLKSINRQLWISEAAYYKALARAFEPGKALDDWLAAESAYFEMVVTCYISVLEEDGPMTIVSLQELATLIGIDSPDGLISEVELIRAIQDATGHIPCFRSESRSLCEKFTCKWRPECQKLISAWY